MGNRAFLTVDARDLGEVAARKLMRCQGSKQVMASRTVDVVDPEVRTGDTIAAIWTEALGRPVTYTGDDLDAFKNQLSAVAPSWLA